MTGWRWGRRVLLGMAVLCLISSTSVVVGAPRSEALTATAREAVIVRAAPGQLGAVELLLTKLGGRLGEQLKIIDGFAASLPLEDVARLSASPSVVEVSPDASIKLDEVDPTLGYDPTADDGSMHYIEQVIGAPQAWAEGATGAGVDVALIDTGVSPVAGLDEPGKVINGPDLSVDADVAGLTDLDEYGHGTHMASIIAGRDDDATTAAQYNNPTTFVGVAPDATIVNVKVGSESGAVDVSQVIAGIDWVVQNATSNGLNIKVLNLSFGTNSLQPYTLDPLDYAAEVAWRDGITVVVSAGNDGAAATSLEDPANDPFVIAVGAEDTDSGGVVDAANGPSVAAFTSAGSTTRTVDVIAPGVHVLGLDDPGSYIDTTYPSARVGTRFFRGSGTSQAAAVVSGAVALLAQKFPTATPNELKYLLDMTAAPLKGVSAQAQGHGVIQVGRAASLNVGQLQQLVSGGGPPLTSQQLAAAYAALTAQPWTSSTGTGSLNASRGGSYLTDAAGAELQGELDVWGGTVNTTSLAAQETAGTAWTDGFWNGDPLLSEPSAVTMWDGTPAASTDFSNMRWSNMRWSGSGWSNMRWSDDGWANMRWAGDGWD